MTAQENVKKIENLERILEIYKKRASRKEFPSASYIAYSQFGMITGD
jgi:hypothetical protein